ncbi:hypothetical protein D3C87_1719080 [compost metagenome]
MAAPAVERGQRRVVVREIVVRHLDRHPGVHVAEILVAERGRIIFDMVEHVEPVAALLMHEADAHLVGFHQDFQIGLLLDILATHLCPT